MELQADKVSVDMIDFVIELSLLEFNKMIKPIAEIFDADEHMEYYRNNGWKNYRHNWVYTIDEIDSDGVRKKYSFFFCYSHNISHSSRFKFRLSYNPNKVPADDRVLSYLIHIFRFYHKQLTISSFDVAFDYEGISTRDLNIDKGRKRLYTEKGYPKSDPTYYIGENGGVKIYDKANEETNNSADYLKTRYEITIRDKIPSFIFTVGDWKYSGEIPICYIKYPIGMFDNKDLSPTDKILLFSVFNDYPMDKLTYEQRKKVERLADAEKHIYTKIKPPHVQVEKAIKKFILSTIYFIN